MTSSGWNSGKVYYVSPVPRVMRKFRFDMINPYQESLLKSKPRSPTTQYIQLYSYHNSRTFGKNKYNRKNTKSINCAQTSFEIQIPPLQTLQILKSFLFFYSIRMLKQKCCKETISIVKQLIYKLMRIDMNKLSQMAELLSQTHV